MNRYVVDTNVPIVANGKADPDNKKNPTVTCRLAAVNFLKSALESDVILLDLAGEIQKEYQKHLQARGQPGVGDRFYLEVLNSSPSRIERIQLPKNAAGEYEDFPNALRMAGFDPSDRKFAALAKRENVPVVNAVDSDWLNHQKLLKDNGLMVKFICGCNPADWFEG